MQISSISKINSFIGALIYITGYAYSEIFFRLSSGECTGNFFLLISIYFIISFTKSDNKTSLNWSLIFGFLAALSKETYLILYPLIFAIPFLFIETNQWKSFFSKNIKGVYLIVGSFVVLVLCLYITIAGSGVLFSYGTPLSKQEMIINNAIWIFKWFLLFSPLVVIALLDYLRENKFRNLIPILLFSLAWIIAELVIYNRVIISFSQGRYMMPSGLIFILLIVLSMEHFKKYSKGYFLVFFLVLALIFRNGKIVYINANEFNSRATAFNVLIDKLVDKKPEKIAIYGGFEFFKSLNTHFTYKNYFPDLITTPVVHKKDYKNDYNDTAFRNEWQEKLKKQYQFKTLEELKNDTSVNFMVTAEPEEYQAINYEAVMKTFKHVEKVSVSFSNPSFKDLLNQELWTGNFKNAQRTYLIFSK